MSIRKSAPAASKGRSGRGLLIKVLVAMDRIALRLLAPDGELKGRRLAPYATPALTRDLEAEGLRMRDLAARKSVHLAFDAELGWEPLAGRTFGKRTLDRFGARESGHERADLPLPGKRRVLVFGCSFVEGTEVENDETWPRALEAERSDLEVFNFGVPAYGLGQALMRMERRAPGLGAHEIWLALMPSAAQRPTTSYRLFLRPWTPIPWLKPSFRVDDAGGLVRVPNPVASVDETVRLFEEPGALSELLAGVDPWYDAVSRAFEPGCIEHRSFLGRAYWTWRTFTSREQRRGQDALGQSLVPVHIAIAREFRSFAERQGAAARYLILPAIRDLPPPHGDGGIITDALVEELKADGIEVLDVTPAVLAVPEAERWAPGGHYSAATNHAVGAWLAEQVR